MRRYRKIAAATTLLATCVALRAQRPNAEPGSLQSSADAPAGPDPASAVMAIGDSAAVFVENRGQFDPAVEYKLTGRAGTVWLTATGIIYEGVREICADGEPSWVSAAASLANFGLPRTGLAGPPRTGLAGSSSERAVFSETFRNVALEAGQPASATYEYFTDTDAARWPVRAFSRVDYKDVWPGISVRLVGNSIGIEQEFIVQAGANTDNIAVTYEGIDGMTIDEHGSLVIGTALGTLREGMPKVYQEVSGHRIGVPGRYKLTGLGTYGFQLGSYAREYPLVIGPIQFNFSRSFGPATGAPVINFFSVAPTSTLPGQATIGTLSVSGATTATINGVSASCSNGECAGTIQFYPTSTTNYVLEATGAGGNVSASQEVEVGRYEPNPPPVPTGLQVTWQGACWLRDYPKRYCNGACQGMTLSVNIPTPPSQLPLEATLYLGTTTCNPDQQDNFNDTGFLTGSGGWIFWFTHHPSQRNTSAIWTIGNQSSGCVSYANAPSCQ